MPPCAVNAEVVRAHQRTVGGRTSRWCRAASAKPDGIVRFVNDTPPLAAAVVGGSAMVGEKSVPW